MKATTKIIIGLILIVILLLIFGYGSYQNAIRIKSNYDNLVLENDAAQIIHTGENYRNKKELDSLAKLLDIRLKTIKTIFQTKYNYKDSIFLVPFYQNEIVYDTVPVPKQYIHRGDCYDLSLVADKDTIYSELTLHDDITGYLHWERPHKFWFIHWGRKEYFLKVHSECLKDTLKIDNLIIKE
jgi:hypothetical protein